MNFIASGLRFRDTRRVTPVRHLALGLVAVLATLLPPLTAWADGPLTFVTSVPLGFRAHDIILEGDRAYVATEKGLTILNISDPEHPVLVGPAIAEASSGGNRSQGLAKKGNYVYLAAGKAGMQIINVSNELDPQTVAKAWNGGNIYDVAVHPTADAAYAISYGGELYVWNIANPAAPVLTQTIGVLHWRGVCNTCVQRMRDLVPSGGAQAVGVSTAGKFVSVVDWNYGGYYAWTSDPLVVAGADPLHLKFVGTHRAPVSFRSEIDLSRGVVYILGTYSKGSGVHTVPLSVLLNDPDDVTYGPYLPPAGVEICDTCDFLPSSIYMDGGGIGFSSNGKYVFYAGGRGNGEVRVIDATDPANLVSQPGWSMPLGPHYLKTAQGEGIVSRGDYLLVAASLLGVQVYRFPGLSSP